jgi:hypothetical protein
MHQVYNELHASGCFDFYLAQWSQHVERKISLDIVSFTSVTRISLGFFNALEEAI